MPLRVFRNIKTLAVIRVLGEFEQDGWEEILTPPNVKMMETINKATGKSKVKGQQKTLTARSRNHARDVDLADQMRVSIENGMEKEAGKSLLNSKGERRRKIDDL